MILNILLATTNIDKAQILQYLIMHVYNHEGKFSLLTEYPGVKECEEIGSIEQRARDKASWYSAVLRDKADVFIAADDGIEIVTHRNLTPMSSEVTDEILQDTFPLNTIVKIHRAIAWKKQGGRVSNVVTVVPFSYAGNPENIRREKGKYPLSDVLIPEGYTKVYSKLTAEEQREFTAKHSKNFFDAWLQDFSN